MFLVILYGLLFRFMLLIIGELLMLIVGFEIEEFVLIELNSKLNKFIFIFICY